MTPSGIEPATCSSAPQPTAPPRAPNVHRVRRYKYITIIIILYSKQSHWPSTSPSLFCEKLSNCKTYINYEYYCFMH